MKPALPIIATGVVVVLLAAGALAVWLRTRTHPDGHTPLPAAWTDAPPAFALVDGDGTPVSAADLRGRAALVYFGFTTCPDVCPTELAWMARVLRALGPAGERVQPIFITVDPERDTPEKLRGYATLFHPRIRSLTGTPGQIAAAAAAFGVIYRKSTPVSAQPGFYLIDHTMTTFALGADGRIVHRLSSHDLTPADAADLIRPMLGATP